MSETREQLQRTIDQARDLKSVVRSMKSLAAASIGQYEEAVRALEDYWRAVQLAWSVSLRQPGRLVAPRFAHVEQKRKVGAVVFGSDQGLVGSFNERAARLVQQTLPAPDGPRTVWAVGDRIHTFLEEEGIVVANTYEVPNGTDTIAGLVVRVLLDLESHLRPYGTDGAEVFIFHNRPTSASGYETTHQRLLPLDQAWREALVAIPWPRQPLPEILQDEESTMMALVDEYLFVSLYKACAESLASENAARLAAMQRAERNIDDLLEDLQQSFHRLRQSTIDAELFDLVGGYELGSQGGPRQGLRR